MLLMANNQIQKQPTSLETDVPITHHCYPEAARGKMDELFLYYSNCQD